MNGLDVRKVGYVHDLNKQLKTARDHGLGSNNSRKDSDDNTEVKCSRWDGIEKGITVCICCYICIPRDVGCLADVGQEQAWVGKAKPGQLNSPFAESSKISE